MTEVSVIIPHYNTPKLLEITLDSVLAGADREKLQVIVVDDKSDKAVDELNAIRASEKYEGVLFLDNTTDKKGAGVCRNIALKHAKGRFILFADADDYFMPGYFDMISKYLKSDADMIYFMPTSVQLDTHAPASRHRAYAQLLEAAMARNDEKSKLELIYTFVTPWSKLIRSSIIADNNIEFDEIAVANDVMFMTKCAYHAANIKYDSNVMYCVTRAAKTLTTKKDEAKFDLREEVLLRRFDYLKERLTKKQLKAVHINRIALSHIVNAILYGYGMKKAFALYRSYRKHHMPLLDAGLFNPFVLCKQAATYLSWRREDKKYQ